MCIRDRGRARPPNVIWCILGTILQLFECLHDEEFSVISSPLEGRFYSIDVIARCGHFLWPEIRTIASFKSAGVTRLHGEAQGSKHWRREDQGGRGIGTGVPLPNRLRGPGKRCELPQLGPGHSPALQCIFGIFEAHRTANKSSIFRKRPFNRSIRGHGSLAPLLLSKRYGGASWAPQWCPGQSPARQSIFGIFEAHRTVHKSSIFRKRPLNRSTKGQGHWTIFSSSGGGE